MLGGTAPLAIITLSVFLTTAHRFQSLPVKAMNVVHGITWRGENLD